MTTAFTPAIDILSHAGDGAGDRLRRLAGASRTSSRSALLAAFLIYVQQFFRPIQLISAFYTQAQSALAGAERIYGILDEAARAGRRAGRASSWRRSPAGSTFERGVVRLRPEGRAGARST